MHSFFFCSRPKVQPFPNIKKRLSKQERRRYYNGAAGRNRTADTRIFSPLLYRLSYRGILYSMATRMGLEPTTSAVTGRHSNQLNYRASLNYICYYIEKQLGCQHLFLNFFQCFSIYIKRRLPRYSIALILIC